MKRKLTSFLLLWHNVWSPNEMQLFEALLYSCYFQALKSEMWNGCSSRHWDFVNKVRVNVKKIPVGIAKKMSLTSFLCHAFHRPSRICRLLWSKFWLDSHHSKWSQTTRRRVNQQLELESVESHSSFSVFLVCFLSFQRKCHNFVTNNAPLISLTFCHGLWKLQTEGQSASH